MKPALKPVPRDETARSDPSPRIRNRSSLLRRKILKDARQASKGYILAFTVPAGGE
ncbi:MAG: hypothetical protein HY815_04205 [Candidatus Riflebacteria bacterium]|nr:hypothetical protein [Candidatus Riflebacteria bacterium]